MASGVKGSVDTALALATPGRDLSLKATVCHSNRARESTNNEILWITTVRSAVTHPLDLFISHVEASFSSAIFHLT